jgi:very-short-patch-repair endonuclease
VGKFIVDFICFEKMLVLELDGGQHGTEEEREKDSKRDEWMRQNDYQVLRFSNSDVNSNLDGVLRTIEEICKED